jgi:hypothetical protein
MGGVLVGSSQFLLPSAFGVKSRAYCGNWFFIGSGKPQRSSVLLDQFFPGLQMQSLWNAYEKSKEYVTSKSHLRPARRLKNTMCLRS